MAVTPEQMEEIIKEVKKAQGMQTAAWMRVIRVARAWAQMKTHGSYIQPNGSVCTVGYSEIPDQLKFYQQDLLRSIEQAFLEDALTGQAIQQALS